MSAFYVSTAGKFNVKLTVLGEKCKISLCWHIKFGLFGRYNIPFNHVLSFQTDLSWVGSPFKEDNKRKYYMKVNLNGEEVSVGFEHDTVKLC